MTKTTKTTAKTLPELFEDLLAHSETTEDLMYAQMRAYQVAKSRPEFATELKAIGVRAGYRIARLAGFKDWYGTPIDELC
jgi:hypothetical protein